MIFSLPLRMVCQPRVSGKGGFRSPWQGRFQPNARLHKDLGLKGDPRTKRAPSFLLNNIDECLLSS
jgi:hypothetical protein